MRYEKQRKWAHRHRFHIGAAILDIVVGLPLLWFLLAYGGLPRAWSHHEHRKGKLDGVLISYTAQAIPGDPVNLAVTGAQPVLDCLFARGGWSKAEPVSLRTGAKIGASVILGRPYPDAPVSPLYLDDRKQDIAYQIDEGASADRRHHVRFWRQPGTPGGVARWLASATFDRGVGLSLFTLQITHHIGPDVDRERDMVTALLMRGGAVRRPDAIAGRTFGRVHRNGGGDKYFFDGRIRVLNLPAQCRHERDLKRS